MMAMKVTQEAVEAMIGRGVYSPREAGLLIGASTDTVSSWVRGRKGTAVGAVFKRDYDELAGKTLLSFYDLIELWVVEQLRRRGMSLQRIRKQSRKAAEALNVSHPFGTRRVAFYFGVGRPKSLVMEDERGWTDVETGQLLIKEILAGYFERVDFDPTTDAAVRFWPAGRDVPVVVDPQRGYGAPTVEGTRLSVDLIKRLIGAGDSVEQIARAYEIRPAQVEAARDFEFAKAA